MSKWIPRDGDILVTRDNFIFYAFGYEHPVEGVISFLKYIPSKFKGLLPVRFLERNWKLGKVELFRAAKLYTAENFQIFLQAFRNNFPEYICFCPFRNKEVISVPLNEIKEVYEPNQCLTRLFKIKRKDCLEKLPLELVALLSSVSGVPLEDFGVHGSIALNMHTTESDVDLVVYGAQNFRRVEEALEDLAKEGNMSYVFTKRLDKMRKYKGRYKGKIFAYNAVRKFDEINIKYGSYKYFPIKPVTFQCKILDDNEAMFRPAIYKITDYQPINPLFELDKDGTPTRVVSMIGYYRNVAKQGDKVKVSGMLERVENVQTGDVCFQVVVGTGTCEDEYIWPL